MYSYSSMKLDIDVYNFVPGSHTQDWPDYWEMWPVCYRQW